MTKHVYIHVGPNKTGTTYVQGMLMVNRQQLADQGMLFPMKNLRAQGRAIHDVLGHERIPSTGRSVKGEWDNLAANLAAWDGPSAVMSYEMLSSLRPAAIAGLRKTLGDYQVHVVYTARDLARVAPAMWQTALRSKQTFTWEEYATSLSQPRQRKGTPGAQFWYKQDAPAVLARWGKHLPTENLHVVTVPRPGSPPELLWQRFCAAIGVDASGSDPNPVRSNPSLGTAEAELIRRVNRAMADSGIDGSPWLYWTRWLGRQLETREQKASFTLPAADFDWVTRRSHEVIEGIRAGGYQLVGDLADLVPQPVPDDKARHPSDTADAAVLDVAIDTIRRMMLELAKTPTSLPRD